LNCVNGIIAELLVICLPIIHRISLLIILARLSIEFVLIPKSEKITQKLVRNRESARNSRKRKKIFIELLEHKVASISEELEKTKKVLETNNQYLNKLSLQT